MSHNDDVRMDYDAMDDMIRAMLRSAKAFDQISCDLRRAVSLLDEGFINEAGDRMVGVISNRMIPFFDQTSIGFEEIAKRLEGAMHALRDGDTSASGLFNDK